MRFNTGMRLLKLVYSWNRAWYVVAISIAALDLTAEDLPAHTLYVLPM